MKKNYKADEGLTLIEIMVVLAVIGIISTAIYNVQLTGFKTFKFNQDRINLNQEARIAMLKMSKKIKEAVEVKNDESWPNDNLVIKWEESGNSVYFAKYWIEEYKLYYNEVSAAEIKNYDPTFDPNTEWPNWTSMTGKQPIATAIAEDITFDAQHTNDNDLIDLVKVELKLDLTPEGDSEADYKLTNQFFVRNAR